MYIPSRTCARGVFCKTKSAILDVPKGFRKALICCLPFPYTEGLKPPQLNFVLHYVHNTLRRQQKGGGRIEDNDVGSENGGVYYHLEQEEREDDMKVAGGRDFGRENSLLVH